MEFKETLPWRIGNGNLHYWVAHNFATSEVPFFFNVKDAFLWKNFPSYFCCPAFTTKLKAAAVKVLASKLWDDIVTVIRCHNICLNICIFVFILHFYFYFLSVIHISYN